MTLLTEWQSRFDQWFRENWDHEDKAHDLAHLQRVWASAQKIMQGTDANPLIVLTACYFHDIVNLPKNHPERHLASRYAARETLRVLQADFTDFPTELYPAVSHAVEAHSFSAGIPAETIEAKIVQDSDRLESLGAIGLARVFTPPELWAGHCSTVKTRLPAIAHWMISAGLSITFRPNCWAYPQQCTLKPAGRLPNTMQLFWLSIWPG